MEWFPFLLVVVVLTAMFVADARQPVPIFEMYVEAPMKGREAERMLLKYGICRDHTFSHTFHYTNAVIVLMAIFYAVVLMSFLYQGPTGGHQPGTTQPSGAIMLQASLLLSGFIVAYIQWRLARYEASIEKYYDRLDIANRRLNTLVEKSWDHIKSMRSGDSGDDVAEKAGRYKFSPYANPEGVGVSLFDMWVFSELDNLEYVIEKYRRSFIELEHMCRGLHAFKGRCKRDPEFMRKASEFCDSAIYHSELRKAVKAIQKELAAAKP
jgi:hypothetical protein